MRCLKGCPAAVRAARNLWSSAHCRLWFSLLAKGCSWRPRELDKWMPSARCSCTPSTSRLTLWPFSSFSSAPFPPPPTHTHTHIHTSGGREQLGVAGACLCLPSPHPHLRGGGAQPQVVDPLQGVGVCRNSGKFSVLVRAAQLATATRAGILTAVVGRGITQAVDAEQIARWRRACSRTSPTPSCHYVIWLS